VSDEIIPLVKNRIPAIVGFDPVTQTLAFGDQARLIGLNGKTTVFNFKPVYGLRGKEFSEKRKYWYYVPDASGQKSCTETFTAKKAGQRCLRCSRRFCPTSSSLEARFPRRNLEGKFSPAHARYAFRLRPKVRTNYPSRDRVKAGELVLHIARWNGD
jgi:hypothetical protein